MAQLLSSFSPDFKSLVGTSHRGLEEYGRFQQHLGLLEDPHRVSAYLKAIAKTVPGDTVVDVGAGTGVWAIAALKHGYKRAILVEPSRKIGQYARHMAELNGVSDRVTIVPAKLEDMSLSDFPASIDLIVTETLSSLLFGFGSWDFLPNLASRLANPRSIIPGRGKLYASLASKDYSSRGPNAAGLSLLSSAGISTDLFERTFRSGGNIYDKKAVIAALIDDQLKPECIADFDFCRPTPISMNDVYFETNSQTYYSGAVFYWDVDLCSDQADTKLSSLDPGLTSWSPVYIPFTAPMLVGTGQKLLLRLELHALDSPYKYAFRLSGQSGPLSNMLYW
jgi:SAM-dependent methyltransferase